MLDSNPPTQSAPARTTETPIPAKSDDESITTSTRTSSSPHHTQTSNQFSPPTHWLLGLLAFLTATVFGYQTILLICFSLPIFSFALLVLLVLFNVGLSYCIEYQNYRPPSTNITPPSSIQRRRKLLHDHLSFSTPAAYSAALIKKSWENQFEWRHQPLHSSLKPKTGAVLDRLIAKIMRDFVWKWYHQIVPPPYTKPRPTSDPQHLPNFATFTDTYSSPAFPLSVEKTIRHSIRILFDRLGSIDVANLIVHQILPILTTHVEAFRQAEYDLRGTGLPEHRHSNRLRTEPRCRLYRAFFSSGNDEIDLLLSRLHADVLRRKSQQNERNGTTKPGEGHIKTSDRLHPAVDVPTPNSQPAEQAHLRKLLEHLLPIVLPGSESKSPGVKTLVIEILACAVIAPVIDLLSDPDFWNRIMEERAGDVIREQKMVEQLRQVLDEQLSFATGLSKMEASENGTATIATRKPQTASKLPTEQRTPPRTIGKNNGILDHEFTSAESISIKTTPKEFDRFSRSIQRCNTLFDVRRLKNDVETQIRKTEAELIGRFESERPTSDKNQPSKNSSDSNTLPLPHDSQHDLKKFLERLSAVRDILDHRLIVLGGSGGPVNHSWSADVATGTDPNSITSSRAMELIHKHQPSRKPSQILQEILRDRESPALSYFTEFMDRRQRVNLIQFWLAVEGLKNPLEEDLVPSIDSVSVKLLGRSIRSQSYASSIYEAGTKNDLPELDLDAMKADIQAIVEINFSTVEATELLGFKKREVLPLVQFVTPHLAKMYDTAMPTQATSQSGSMNTIYLVKEARAALFSMQRQVFDLMLAEDFPAFAASGDLYLRATASLWTAEPSARPDGSPTGMISVNSFPNLIDHKQSNLKTPGAVHKYFPVTKPHHLSDHDSLRPRNSDSPLSSQPDRSLDHKITQGPLVRANSFSGSLPLINTRLSLEHDDERPQSAKSQDDVTPAKRSLEMRKTSQSTSHIIQTLLRPNSTDTNNYRIQITPSPVPPQVTLQEAFDERPPGQRLTGDTQYDQQLFSLSNYNIRGQFPSSSSSQPSSLKFHQPNHTIIHPSKFHTLSPSLDFLISPCKGDRAPLFEDDLNFSIQAVASSSGLPPSLTFQVDGERKKVIDANNRELGNDFSSRDSSKLISPTSGLAQIGAKHHEPVMSSDASIALQEALSSIISTSDQISRPGKHEETYHLFHPNFIPDENDSTVDLSLKNSSRRDHSDLTLGSPLSKPSQRKRLFDDDDEDDDDDGDNEEDDDDDGDVLLLLEPNHQTAPKRRKQISPGRGTIISTPANSSTSSATISNISEANERILKLENELNLLSSLMRRAELTGNKLEIRLVRKSIESVGKELSEVLYRKTRLIEQREISLGGFRGKLVPGRVKLSITGTTIGGNQNHLQNSKQTNSLTNTLTNNHLTGYINISQQEYVLYKIEVHKLSEDGSFGSGWIVHRRYNEFNSLHKTLKELYPISRQLEFPAKQLFGLGISSAVGLGAATTTSGAGQTNNNNKHRPNATNITSNSVISAIGQKSHFFNHSFIDQRRSILERYLKALIQIPVLCESPELAKFLSRSKNQPQQQTENFSLMNNKGIGSLRIESISSFKKRVEILSNTSGFMQSIYKSIVTPSSSMLTTTESNKTAVPGADSGVSRREGNNGNNNNSGHNNERKILSPEREVMFSPISSSSKTNSHHSHTLSTGSSTSFAFSSQSLLDCLTKGFNSASDDGRNKDTIEINELQKLKRKSQFKDPIDSNTVTKNEDEDDETEEEFTKGLLNLSKKFESTNNTIPASTTDEPSEFNLLTNFTKPISDFLIEIFELNHTDHWIRKHGIIIILQQILGGTIERKFRETVSELMDDEHLSQMIISIEESIWISDRDDQLGAGELRPKPEPRSIEEKLLTCEGAYRKLSVIMPEYAASILGRSNARIATRRTFSMIQNRRLNKHLIYTILDQVLKTLFPELIDLI